MFGHSHCNANNSEVEVNIRRKFTLTPVTPLFKRRMGKWRVLSILDSRGGGGGGGREGEGGHLLLYFILSKTVTPFRNIACGFRFLDEAGPRDI